MSRLLLKEIAESVGYGVTASACDEPVGPKFLRITDIQDGRVNWNDVPWCDGSSRSVEAAKLRPGDIVFARTGATTGKSFLIGDCPESAVFASYLIRVRLREEDADPGYVSHFFRTADYWQQITKSSRGVAQPGVNATTLKSLQIPLPPLSEQKRIARILDAADALRAKRRESIVQLDTLLQSAFLEMFGDPITNPMGWDTIPLGAIGSVQGGLQVTAKRKPLPIERPYLRVANVYRGYLDLDEIKTIRLTETEERRTKLEEEDILIVEGHGNKGEIGRCARWDGSIKHCVHQNHLIRLRCDPSIALPVYIESHLNSEGGRKGLTGTSRTTSGLNTISVSKVKSCKVPLPPRNLQQRFADIVNSVKQQNAHRRAHLDELSTLFASLQSRAFRGDL